MKIAIISDTHNNMANFKKAIDYIKGGGIKLILHCGDIQSQETIDEAVKYFAAPKGEPRPEGRGGEIKFV